MEKTSITMTKEKWEKITTKLLNSDDPTIRYIGADIHEELMIQAVEKNKRIESERILNA